MTRQVLTINVQGKKSINLPSAKVQYEVSKDKIANCRKVSGLHLRTR